jgi:hypothetical protein
VSSTGADAQRAGSPAVYRSASPSRLPLAIATLSTVRSPLTEPLLQLAHAWRNVTRSSRRRMAWALVGLAWVLALLFARHGTPRARLLAASTMALSAALAVGWRLLERHRLRDPGRILLGLARRVDPARADRALRALSLIDPRGEVRAQGTSPELARLHVARMLALLPSERIVERAARTAGMVGIAAIVVGVCVLGVTLANAWSLLEGSDVLVARHGIAPVAMRWLDDVEIVARPPEYLHESEQHDLVLSPLALPFGTLLTLRGVPVHSGRRLLLADGAIEVPFVDDGAGAVVARWPLARSTTLHVVARFGAVTIPEPDALSLRSIPDAAPVVTLEGAPRQVRLLDENEDLAIKYEATDDHGLREVHLVLRSGTREERRVLARLDGETTSSKGGQALRLRDPFLRKSHAPVEITVEAKDNDPLTGPKWGASPALTLLPPDVGEPEALRLDALRALRDAMVDTLAWRLVNEPPPVSKVAGSSAAFVAADKGRLDADDVRLQAALQGTYAGVRVPGRLVAMLGAQSQKMRAAVTAELRSPAAAAHAVAVKATERFVLVLDAVIRGLGFRDTRESATQLADVADDLALGASQMQGDDGDARSRGGVRMNAAQLVLAGGGRVMLRLGSLGRDLGEIVDADLARVARARVVPDLMHAELAARDLAARLREPDPSFGSRGRAGRAGGESGGGRGTPGEDAQDSGDEVDEAQQAAEQDLERLAQDHASEMGNMEQALAGATSEQELKEMRDEARRHAGIIREAVRELPTVGLGSDSWTSKGAAARELAEQMAHSLEEVRPDEAVQSGRSALGSLDEAKKILQKGAWLEDPNGEEQTKLEEVRRKLDAEDKWAEDALRQMRKRAAERARSQLEEGGEEEGKLADRARDLAQRSGDKGSLPEQAVESIEEAERAARQAGQSLKEGDADRGMEHQREAQRALEQAREELGGDEDPLSASLDPEDKGASSKSPVAIPNAAEHKGPEEFRRRVVRGLGQPANGALKDAVQRYAEGLLR